MCNVKLMKFETKLERANEINEKIDALKKELELLKASIMDDMNEKELKTFENDKLKVNLVNKVSYNYDEKAVAFCKENNINAIKEVVDTAKINACVKAGIVDVNELNKVRTAKESEYVVITTK